MQFTTTLSTLLASSLSLSSLMLLQQQHGASAWLPPLSTSPSSTSYHIHNNIYNNNNIHNNIHIHSSRLQSTTPFEADYYYDEDSTDNPFSQDTLPLAVPSDTKLTLGLNKYSHDTSLCAADSKTGTVLFAMQKERLAPRNKNDAGNVAALVEQCLETLDLDSHAIHRVVVNNHHHRVLPLEQQRPLAHLEWEAELYGNNDSNNNSNGGGIMGSGYEDEENLLPDATHSEISHHLAHAYSTATQAPFDAGIIVVMDGMGETYRTMMHGKDDVTYTSDFDLIETLQQQQQQQQIDTTVPTCVMVPTDLEQRAQRSRFDWREAESVYSFTKSKDDNTIDIVPLFKRFQEEHTPPWLQNHGFENMDSVGALYSRASSHIFGDWNACGKVMGLAPWKQHQWKNTNNKEGDYESYSDDENDETDESAAILRPTKHDKPIVSGSLLEDDALHIDRTLLSGMPLISRNDADLFDPITMVRRRRYDFDDDDDDIIDDDEQEDPTGGKEEDDTAADSKPTKLVKRLPAQVALDAIGVAARIQEDLEMVCLDFVKHFQQQQQQQQQQSDSSESDNNNLCLAGGVGLNSVLNGRLARECGFDQTYISPYPGDDGIAVGCCAFGLYGPKKGKVDNSMDNPPPPLWTQPLSPYLGPAPTEFQMKLAIEAAAPWIDVETIRNDELRIERMVSALDKGSVIALYQGRSELGPRALGHRSILADPRKKSHVRFINSVVKKRESFRPFAPSVLAEEARDWFDLGSSTHGGNNVSPYMSMTALVHEEKRSLIPAVTHVDGSSRLQTVTPEADLFYHKLIKAFYQRTGVPMVLNTSFNTIPSEPIVETPKNAIRSFLSSMGSIDVLFMGDYVIRRKQPDLRKLVGEGQEGASNSGVRMIPACPKRAGRVEFESNFALNKGPTQEEEVSTVTRVRMPDRLIHHDSKQNWFDLADELEGEVLSICDGTNTINDIMAYFTVKPNDEEFTEEEMEDTREIFSQISRRLIRLFEHGFLSW